jgi:transcriptional regulator GlxA family with amidase domain
LRLEKARNLLMHSPLSITAIALATGFASSAHFSTAFRGIYGDAPSRIRSTNRAENVTD